MFDNQEPKALQTELQSFIQQWHGHAETAWGIDPEKLDQVQLPDPLRWLYGFAGRWPGHAYWDTLLGVQDCLSAFEYLRIQDGRLVFVDENQGNWWLGTDQEGKDPAVYVTSGDGWTLVDESLTRFLVTFVLHETATGCPHTASDDAALDKLRAASHQMVPLWLDHPYPDVITTVSPVSFWVSGSRFLVMCHGDSQWCGTTHPSPWDEVPDLFPFQEPPAESIELDPYAPIPDHIQVPAILRESLLRQVIIRHQHKVDYHSGRVALYQKMLDNMADESSWSTRAGSLRFCGLLALFRRNNRPVARGLINLLKNRRRDGRAFCERHVRSTPSPLPRSAAEQITFSLS